MNNILVSGLVNAEININVDKFPVEYSPIEYNFFSVETDISGVGYNIAKALTTLGSNVKLASIIGNDIFKKIILDKLEEDGIENGYILPLLNKTVQSGILNDGERRKILLDLKNIQEMKYPEENIMNELEKIDLAILCNINFSRNLLKIIKDKNILIATDIHVQDNINDEYNKDFMEYADILFLSNEKILNGEEIFIKQLSERYNNKIIVIGMGNKGALIYVKENKTIKHYPAIKTREVINTIGAGDALFSAFNHFYIKTKDPYYSIKLATIFASYKIGENGGAKGFITEEELLKLYKKSN
jgi:ribokinase